MIGIDGSLGTPSSLLDARALSTGAKPADPAGTPTDRDLPGDFDGHLAGLSLAEDKLNDAGVLASLADRTAPASVQQSLLLAAKTAEANRQGGSGPQTPIEAACPASASSSVGEALPDATNLRVSFTINVDGPLAKASDSTAPAVSPRLRTH